MENQDRFKRILAVLIALVTVFATVLAYLESQAGARDDVANRDTKVYAMQALGFQVAGDARANFEVNSVYQVWDELDTLALSAGDDAGREELYTTLKDEVARFSPLFDPKSGYFSKEDGVPDLARFEADTYVYELEVLQQDYKAAAAVKDGWDTKANTYIVHLTLLAVALFLFGLSLTVATPSIQRIFTGVGLAITLVAVAWALNTWSQPVPDLREQKGAIAAFAKGRALAHRGMDREAAAEFDQALQLAPDYVDALAARAQARYNLEKYEDSANDLKAALRLSPGNPQYLYSLGNALYEMGRFDEAGAAYAQAVEASPDDLFARFGGALNLLASGQVEKAKTEYQDGMQVAARLVADAAARKLAPPADVWDALDEASGEIDGLCANIESGDDTPPRDRIGKPEEILKAQEGLVAALDSMSTSLEYTGRPPQGTLQARLSAISFGDPVYDDKGELTDIKANEEAVFPDETAAVALEFDYEGMKDGQEVVLKVFKGIYEEPSWRIVDQWTGGASGTWWLSLAPGYTDTFVFPAETYTVEIFVDGHLATRGSFEVEEPAP